MCRLYGFLCQLWHKRMRPAAYTCPFTGVQWSWALPWSTATTSGAWWKSFCIFWTPVTLISKQTAHQGSSWLLRSKAVCCENVNHVRQNPFKRKHQQFPFWETGLAAVMLHILLALLKVCRLLLEVLKYCKSLVKWIRSNSISKPLKNKVTRDCVMIKWVIHRQKLTLLTLFYLTALKRVWLGLFKWFYVCFLV